ncbi:MAG TPA: fatty acid desaturase [Acidimicrobiales bacterium]|nr:fatty acid desaturase [Acidimicrobiales bacterium]
MPIGALVGLVSGILTCLVTEIYCHRCLAHRAFRVHPLLGSCLGAFMQVYGGVHPERWAGVHRLHHRYADTPLDPHSPLQRHPLLVLVGTPYLFAVARRRLPADSAPGPGIRHLAARALISAFWLFTIGLVPTLTALAVHLVCYLGIMGMVNTVGHRSGSTPHPEFPGHDLAWLAIPLLGHGYHNSHHAHPAAARMGLLDPIWPVLRLLSGVGLVALDEQRVQTQPRTCCMAST